MWNSQTDGVADGKGRSRKEAGHMAIQDLGFPDWLRSTLYYSNVRVNQMNIYVDSNSRILSLNGVFLTAGVKTITSQGFLPKQGI